MHIKTEDKLFSELSNSPVFQKALRSSSVSDIDAHARMTQYKKLFTGFRERMSAMRLFSGSTEMNPISSQFFNASVTSYVSSLSGFMAVERAMDEAEALLTYVDTIGTSDGRNVMKNIGGPEDFSGMRARINNVTPQVTATALYIVNLGKKIIPGTVSIDIYQFGTIVYNVTDDKKGNLIGTPGSLAAGTGPNRTGVTYSSGQIIINQGAGWTATTGQNIVITAYEDAAGNPSLTGNAGGKGNRITLRESSIRVLSRPELLEAEMNLLAIASMSKSTGIQGETLLSDKLVELFTKLINLQLVTRLDDDYVGTTYPIDITSSTTGFSDYQSAIQKFSNELVSVNTALAEKSIKGVRATAYVCGKNVADLFAKTKIFGEWTPNTESTYINDLYGYFNGVPVIRHLQLGDNEAYAIHKTIDGNMAPLMRGIFLPLTDTPLVGNYNNPTQIVKGVYYQEGTETISTDLVAKFTVAQD